VKRIEKLAFEAGETYILGRIENAWRILGGQAVCPDDPEAKPFRRIRGNDFSESDVTRAIEILVKRARRLLEEAKAGECPYPEVEAVDTLVDETWRNGLVSSAHLALKEAESFLHMVDDALINAGYRKLPADIRARLIMH
jgi:DNA-directed RNA polymerase beta' subunit